MSENYLQQDTFSTPQLNQICSSPGSWRDQTDAKHCLCNSPKHLILNSSRQLSHMLLFVSVLAKRLGSGYSSEKIKSGLRKEMSFPSSIGVHLYHRSFLTEQVPELCDLGQQLTLCAENWSCPEVSWTSDLFGIPGWVWRSLDVQVLWKVVWQFPGVLLFWKRCF